MYVMDMCKCGAFVALVVETIAASVLVKYVMYSTYVRSTLCR